MADTPRRQRVGASGRHAEPGAPMPYEVVLIDGVVVIDGEHFRARSIGVFADPGHVPP
jgi:hypothetical protein